MTVERMFPRFYYHLRRGCALLSVLDLRSKRVLLPLLPDRKDYGFIATLDAEIRRNLDREIGYGITDVWEDPNEITEEIPVADVAGLDQKMTDFVTTVRQDTD
ncbi:hypothetical protein Tco_1467123 [Tanacetum coccineum]